MSRSALLEVFLVRAQDFARGMRLLQGEDGYAQSAALLAIQSAIAYTDALRTGLGHATLSSDDHNDAIKALRELLSTDDSDGIIRLQKLLSHKSDVAYGKKRLDGRRLTLLCTDSMRFAVWANKIGGDRVSEWRSSHD